MSKVENYQHVTVLLHEAVDALAIREDGIYVDGTFGRGGHSRLILSRLGKQGRLVVFDKDPEAIAVANELAVQDKRVSVVHNGFETFQTALDELGIDKIDGALLIWGFRRRKLTMAAADSVSALMRRWICGWIRLAGCLRQNGLQPHPNRIYTR